MIVIPNIVRAMHSHYQREHIYIKDMHSKYIYGNEAFLSFYNLSNIDQIYQKTDFDLPWEKYAEEYVRNDQEAISTGELQVIEKSIKINGGDDMLLLSQKRSFYDPITKQSGMIGITIGLSDKVINDLTSIVEVQEVKCLKFSDTLFSAKVNEHADIPLTTRELDILYYILHGLSQKQVAARLNLSVRTVEDYIGHIKNKLKCGNKYQIFEFAIHNGLMNIIPKHVLSAPKEG